MRLTYEDIFFFLVITFIYIILGALLKNVLVSIEYGCWGAWVPQSVERPTSAQVMISGSVSSSPASGSVLTARSLQPASDSVSPSASVPPLLTLCLSLSKINKH